MSKDAFIRFEVTGVLIDGRTRFKQVFGQRSEKWAYSINLWRGSVWGVRENGTRKLLKRVS